MNEEQARAWARDRFGAESVTRLERFAALVIEANGAQNLIAPSTIRTIWSRHLVDSAQLTILDDPAAKGTWCDIGSGAGFPGIVIAILLDRPVLLVEPRRKRAEFLACAAEILGLTSVSILQRRVEQVRSDSIATISARAVASLPVLLESAIHLSRPGTRWLLPKGRSAHEEVDAVRGAWHGTFHVEQSITQDDAAIVIAEGVVRR